MDLTGEFEHERPRLTRIAARVLGDPAEAEDAVQQAWLRLARTDVTAVDNLPGWLTTVVTRVCLDRLKAAVPAPHEPTDRAGVDPDPAEEVALADSVGSALHLVLDRLTPAERVALVLHDSFAVDFATIAGILDCTPAAARKHASRARSKVAAPPDVQGTVDWHVVDAFLSAARDGEFSRLLELLAPDVVVAGDPVAVGLGTPARIEGRDAVAEFFDGAAASALPVFVHGRPGAAWFDRGVARVAFDFRVSGGLVTRIDFRAEPEALETISRRRDGDPR
ncbi:MAG: sigma-70 family RNA polymerase sigma factor [Dietzia sp.]